MIVLDFGKSKQPDFKVGDKVHLKVKSIYEMAPGKWRLEVEDVTPLPGAEPIGYYCKCCCRVDPANEHGGLPEGWVKKDFPERAFFLCPECQEDFRYCRKCGCSHEDPCEDGCYWVEEDLCSACAEARS